MFRAGYGGTILGLLLEHIAHNFQKERPGDVDVLRLLGQFEEILVQRLGVFPNDYTVLAARRPRGGAILHRIQRIFAEPEGDARR